MTSLIHTRKATSDPHADIKPRSHRDDNAIVTKNTGVDPALCVAFIGCNRPQLLKRTLEAFYAHMNEREPKLAWEAVWIDQATSVASRSVISRRFQLDARFSAVRPRGQSFVWNLVGHMCRSKYVMFLEDDWVVDYIYSLKRQDFITETLELLDAETEPKLFGALFRYVPDARERCGGQTKLGFNGATYAVCESRAMPMMCGPSVYKRDVLLSLPFFPDNGRSIEQQMVSKQREAGLRMMWVWRAKIGGKRPQDFAFRHIGGAASTRGKNSTCIKQPL